MTAIGIDFGTSNSTVGVSDEDGARLIALEGDHLTLPSAVFFDLEDRKVRYGRDAVAAYTAEHEGRLMRALKSILGSSLIDDTTEIGERRISFSAIIAHFMRHLKTTAEADLGEPVDQVVLGRPVHYVDGDAEADALAQDQMEQIARAEGFDEVEFQYEPVAAALDYESTCTREELVLVCDIGGGTSDFSLVRVGPDRAGNADRRNDILANTGTHVGGTDLDYRLSLRQIMPLLGMGSRLRFTTGVEGAMPNALYNDLATWHRIAFLYTPKTLADLAGIRREALSPLLIDRLAGVIDRREGHRLAALAEDAKIELSKADVARIALDIIDTGLNTDIDRSRFETDILHETSRVETALAECLALAGVEADALDAIFLTGGSTAVPAIYRACTRLAGLAHVVEGDKFGSVGLGLAADAAARFR